MRLRLFLLLLVTIGSGVVAGFVGSARAGKQRAAVLPAVGSTLVAGRCPLPARFRPAFVAAAADTRLPIALLYAVAKVESDLQPDAFSSAGAGGLLQVMPETARSLDLDAAGVRTNVLAGARYLRLMLDRFQSTDLALAAYNAGPTLVERSGGIPGESTAAYVVRVTGIWRTVTGCT
jgi:peptidoglycan DL-endopeptidase CwlO